MASGMAIEREVISECFEGIIRVEVSRKMLKYVFVCPGFFGFCSATCWVRCQAALSAMVPGIGG